MTDEPEDSAYVVVHLPHTVWVFCRSDEAAMDDQEPGRRWFLSGRVGPWEDGSDRTWAEVCRLGPLAYVGTFVNRSTKEAS